MTDENSSLDERLDRALAAMRATEGDDAEAPAELMWARIAPDVEAVVRAHASNQRASLAESRKRTLRIRRWYVAGVAAAALVVAATALLVTRRKNGGILTEPQRVHSQLASAAPLLERVAARRTVDSVLAAADVRDSKRLLTATRAKMDSLGTSAEEQRALLADLEYALAEVVQGAATDPTDQALFAETLQKRELVKRLRTSLVEDTRGAGS